MTQSRYKVKIITCYFSNLQTYRKKAYDSKSLISEAIVSKLYLVLYIYINIKLQIGLQSNFFHLMIAIFTQTNSS